MADLAQNSVDFAVVGGLAVILSLLTWWVARRRRAHPRQEALLEKAALPYLDTGMLNWEFVRGKLRHDPLYFNFVRRGVLPSTGRVQLKDVSRRGMKLEWKYAMLPLASAKMVLLDEFVCSSITSRNDL